MARGPLAGMMAKTLPVWFARMAGGGLEDWTGLALNERPGRG